MRLTVGAFCAVSLCSIVLLTGCDEAPTYSGPALPPGYKKYEKPPNPQVVLDTSAGKITLELFEDDTPVTVNSFVELIEKKFYDGLTFHRIVKDFMIQGGCPKGDGTGNPGYRFKDEIDKDALARDSAKKANEVPETHHTDQYCLSMANSGPNTNGSQFFIVTNPKGEHGLDNKHTVFGKVIDGKDVVDKLNLTEPLPNTDKPKVAPKIISATVLRKRDHPYKLEASDKQDILPPGSSFGSDGSLKLGQGTYPPEMLKKMQDEMKAKTQSTPK